MNKPLTEAQEQSAPEIEISAAVEPAVERLVPTSRVMDNGLVLVEMQTSAVGYYMRYGDHLKQIANLRAELVEARRERDNVAYYGQLCEEHKNDARIRNFPAAQGMCMRCNLRLCTTKRYEAEGKLSDAEAARGQAQASADTMRKALEAIKLRLHFMGWPNEPMFEGQPDWRKEISLLEAALSPTNDRAAKDGKARA